MYGDVYLNDPLSGKMSWYDWCSHADFVHYYGVYDTGRFLWVLANEEVAT